MADRIPKEVLGNTPATKSLVSRGVFLQNASHKQAPGFLDLTKKAARENDWKDVILHGMLLALGDELMGQVHTYARFCFIVQSSGMGKSRLLDDEFSKSHFLIPINLRPENTRGFLPPDVAVRVFLTKYDSNNPEVQQKSYSTGRACNFLLSLSVHTKDKIVSLGADNKEDRIVKFRELMSKGQTFVSAGENRRNFYADVVKQAQKFSPPRTHDPSNRIYQGAFELPPPFIELGFDQLVWSRKVIYKTLEQLTSSECIAHGKAIVGYNYAVLSQRLALDINTTAYDSAPLIDASEKILKQIANHMRVCVEIRDGMKIIRGIATSEPIFSEAASYIMRQNFPNFDLAESLSNVSGFSIHLGDRGELLVAAFFTWARDNSIVKQLPSLLRRGPSKAEKRTMGEVTRAAHMRFNHFIQYQEKIFIAHRYLIAVMVRGAAVLGANCQAGIDMVFPYLYGSTVFDDKNVSFITVQVKDDSKFSVPDAELFRQIDPFQ
ncbi:hypothetical protein BJV78DRAFT_1280684 [Lactifluus subvellereus]|nr:hypothetical protein BJV78DRAFT_1280684 [Lactifluus subvellereus]